MIKNIDIYSSICYYTLYTYQFNLEILWKFNVEPLIFTFRLFFATLTILFFLCYSYLKTSHAPSSALGWLLLDHSDITEAEENPFFDFVFSLRLTVFCLFRCLFFHRHPGTLNEASSVLIAFKTFSFLAILFIRLITIRFSSLS